MYKAKAVFGSKETKLLSYVWQETMLSALTWGGRQGRERALTRWKREEQDTLINTVGKPEAWLLLKSGSQQGLGHVWVMTSRANFQESWDSVMYRPTLL